MKNKYHWFVIVWLAFIILGNLITAIRVITLFAKASTVTLPGILIILGSLLLIIGAAHLWQGRKLGFYLILVAAVMSIIVHVISGKYGLILFSIAGPAILYAILQIKKDDTPAWDHLT